MSTGRTDSRGRSKTKWTMEKTVVPPFQRSANLITGSKAMLQWRYIFVCILERNSLKFNREKSTKMLLDSVAAGGSQSAVEMEVMNSSQSANVMIREAFTSTGGAPSYSGLTSKRLPATGDCKGTQILKGYKSKPSCGVIQRSGDSGYCPSPVISFA